MTATKKYMAPACHNRRMTSSVVSTEGHTIYYCSAPGCGKFYNATRGQWWPRVVRYFTGGKMVEMTPSSLVVEKGLGQSREERDAKTQREVERAVRAISEGKRLEEIL